MWVTSSGIPKMLIRKANREDPDQTASSAKCKVCPTKTVMMTVMKSIVSDQSLVKLSKSSKGLMLFCTNCKGSERCAMAQYMLFLKCPSNHHHNRIFY